MKETATAEREAQQSHPDYCECSRCESEPGIPFSWIKRVTGRPKRCPNCNSPKWDTKPKWRRGDRTGDAE